MDKIPNFFIVGAAKAGTTSLYYYLKQHPDIYMSPIKEPNYFAKDIDINNFREDYKRSAIIDTKRYFASAKLNEIHLAFITDFDDYIQLFRERNQEKIVGEISNSYLYSKVAAKEIFKYNPNAKILIILRDPIERAFSHYLMNLMIGFTTNRNFVDEVINDYNKSKKGWGISHLYIELGLYYEQVKRYLDIFPKQNIKILLFEDIKDNTEKALKDIFEFLNVDNNVNIDYTRQNVSLIPKNPYINNYIRSIGRNFKPFIPFFLRDKLKKIYQSIFLRKNKPALTNEDREYLKPFFENDINKTQELIQRDLSNWLK